MYNENLSTLPWLMLAWHVNTPPQKKTKKLSKLQDIAGQNNRNNIFISVRKKILMVMIMITMKKKTEKISKNVLIIVSIKK